MIRRIFLSLLTALGGLGWAWLFWGRHQDQPSLPEPTPQAPPAPQGPDYYEVRGVLTWHDTRGKPEDWPKAEPIPFSLIVADGRWEFQAGDFVRSGPYRQLSSNTAHMETVIDQCQREMRKLRDPNHRCYYTMHIHTRTTERPAR